MGIFKYLYQGDNIDLLASGHVVTEFLTESCYVLVIQDSMGEVVRVAQTSFEDL